LQLDKKQKTYEVDIKMFSQRMFSGTSGKVDIEPKSEVRDLKLSIKQILLKLISLRSKEYVHVSLLECSTVSLCKVADKALKICAEIKIFGNRSKSK
jgi:hypothetical protein